MKPYLYLSVMPETLVASMLPPNEFGTYLAVGSQAKIPRETMFFSLKPNFNCANIDLVKMDKACVPHEDGSPKKSLYLSIYRVLEQIPLSAIKSLYLVTRDGRVLELSPTSLLSDATEQCYLYCEICPTNPLVFSVLEPQAYCNFITSPGHSLHIPKIFFMDLKMPDLTGNHSLANVNSISSHIVETHESMLNGNKKAKIVDRRYQIPGIGRGIRKGFYLGDEDNLLFFAFPDYDDLKRNHYEWFKSAEL